MKNFKVKLFLIVLLLVLLANPTAVLADEAKSSWGKVVTFMNVVESMDSEYWVEAESWGESLLLIATTMLEVHALDSADICKHYRNILEFQELCKVIFQKKLEISINKLIKALDKLEGKTLVRKSDGYVRTFTDYDISKATLALKFLKDGGFVRADDFDEYEKKLTNYDNVDQEFLAKAKEVQILAKVRDLLVDAIRANKNTSLAEKRDLKGDLYKELKKIQEQYM